MNANDRAIVGFSMVAHAAFHVYELAIPLFVVVWLDAFGASAAVIGTVVGAGYALVGIGAPVSGALADSYGSKTLVTLSMVGMGAGFLLVSVAPNVWVLGAALVVWGAAASLYHPAGLSLLTRGVAERGTALAYHGAAGNVGMAVGPFLAAVLLTFFDWRPVAGLFLVPALLGVVLAYRFEFDETAAVAADGPNVAHDGGVGSPRELLAQSRLLFAGGFVVAFAIMILHGVYSRGVLTFLPEILAGLPLFDPVPVGEREFEPSQYVYAGLLLLGVAGQYAGGRLTDRGGTERTIVAIYAAIVAVSLLFVPAANAGLAPLLAVCGALGFAVYATAPVRQALIAKYADADVHGLSFGYTYLGVFGVGAAGTTLAGVVLTYGTAEQLFVVFAGFAAVVALLGGYLALRDD